MMNCRDWEALLEDLLAGRLAGDERRRAEAHRETCPACATLYAAARESQGLLTAGDDEALSEAILALTSGPVCAHAESRLPDFMDGALDAQERELLTAHLEHCADCAALAASLAWLDETLPALAPPAPGAAFTRQVMDALAAASARRAAGPLAIWWRRLWQRPRFALELAYAGTLVVVALTSLPISPFREAPGQALQLVKSGPSALAAPLPLDFSRLAGGLSSESQSAWKAGHERVRHANEGAAQRLQGLRLRLSPLLGELWRDLKRFLGELRRHDFAAASSQLSEILGDLKRLGREWQRETPPIAPAPSPPAAVESGRT